MNALLIIIGKLLSLISKSLNLGSGSTWPGHIALSLNKNFVREIFNKNSHLKIVLVAGTNGKTTTAKMIQQMLEHADKKVFRNQAGANLVNGIASSIVLHSSILRTLDYDYAVFEVDENSLPLVMNELTPDFLIVLNLYRDQLDRYGETDSIAKKWQRVTAKLPETSTIILNADDPQIAYLAKSTKAKVFYFGLDDPKLHQKTHQHAADSTYRPSCGKKLSYEVVYFSHSGEWECKNCGIKRPRLDQSSSPIYPLVGIYNHYNTHATLLFGKLNNISNETMKQSLQSFSPAFGRQETLEVNGKRVQIFLSKNPTSFNQSLRTIMEQKPKHVLLVLNDRIPDGRDVSWIWDVDFEVYLTKDITLTISGDRPYDMGVRLKYALQSQNAKVKNQNGSAKFKIYEDLKEAIESSLSAIKENETLYILPTYSAMLEVRKILTGRKIL